MRPSIQVDDFNRLRENLENLNYKFCYEEVLTQCYFRNVDFKENIKSYVEGNLGYTAPTPLTQVTLRCEVEVTFGMHSYLSRFVVQCYQASI